VKKLLNEGGMKKVYLAHDTQLDRDVAFSLVKTEGLDATSRNRVTREAQAMGRLGTHACIVTIHDIGELEEQPYMVMELMAGGDVESLIEQAPDHKLPIEQVVTIAKSVCQGLEFAHSKDIIHRDLKPGNVLLTSDGTPKIGDFGLALPQDVSRLTEHGKIVGTYMYMPPEQAVSGTMSNRSDLYSLGAMLYEMVAGIPPFMGDDPHSIIAQHMTTPPVSPAWHRPDLTARLEALIMQLLEKEPEKRPSSATDVLKALEAIEQGEVTEIASQIVPTVTESPLYRRVFVGRESEQKQLQAAFDTAMSGNGSLMMVVGEAGIGKTALWEHLSTYVTLRGGKTLVGHCYEEGSLSLPYLAFIEAMRSYVLIRDTRNLKKELASGAADVARILSEVRDKLKVQPKLPETPEEDRYRLMQAVTNFLINASNAQPLMVVLEDLHDTDKGTLEMLTHVSRHLAGTRLLIVGTYRDVEVDRSHPLSAALAELRRTTTFGRVLLRGLNPDEVRRMLEGLVRQEVPWSFAETIHRQTEGNPLFVQEVVRHLTEEGIINLEGGRWQSTRDTPLEMSIPEGLRDVIGKRLSRLSQECNRILSIAAVIGREFPLEVLQRIAETSEEKLFTALEEAKSTAVLEERSSMGLGTAFRFTHAFFRQILYEEMFTPRRIRTHQQVGRALEEVYARRLEDHATELAEHFAQSTERDDLLKALNYSEMSARRAMSVSAYGETVRLLEQAIKVQEVLDPGDKAKLCDLSIELCDAVNWAGEPQRLLQVDAPTAMTLAEAVGDNKRASRICQLAMEAVYYYGAGGQGTWATSEAAQWADLADRYAQSGSTDRALADMGLAVARLNMGQRVEVIHFFNQALELARDSNDPATLWLVSAWWLIDVLAPQYTEERLRLAEELSRQPRTGVSMRTLVTGLNTMGRTFLDAGQRRLGQEMWREYQNLADRTGQVGMQVQSMTFDAILATVDGHLEEALDLSYRIDARNEELTLASYSQAWVGANAGRLTQQLYLGKAGDALQRTTPPLSVGERALCLAHIGRVAEVLEILERRILARLGTGSAEDVTPTWYLTQLLEAAVLVRHRDVVDLLLRQLTGSSLRTTVGSGWRYITCIARHLGAADVLLDRYDEARNHYQDALKVCTEMRFRPELALTRLGLAELLLEHYPDEKSDAMEHLDFAIKEFREMKMQPSLERALRHKEILGA